MIIRDKVLDLSEFARHPGGEAYVPYCGKEATEGYDTKKGEGTNHSEKADSMFSKYKLVVA